MATCITCGNDYPKSFQVVIDGNSYTFRLLRVRDPAPRAHLRPLRLPCDRPRCRDWKRHLLLHELRTHGGAEAHV
jgi:hypothetical protein